MYFLIDLGDEKYVICVKHSIYDTHLTAVTTPISGATWASEILRDLVELGNGPHVKRSPLTRYHMRPGK